MECQIMKIYSNFKIIYIGSYRTFFFFFYVTVQSRNKLGSNINDIYSNSSAEHAQEQQLHLYSVTELVFSYTF